jgi:hypothetical protein
MNHKEPPIVPSDLDWAMLAAYIDGEGCILINKNKTATRYGFNLYLRIVVSNTDPRLPKWCRDRFGGVIHIKYRAKLRPTHRPAYSWTANCSVAANVLRGCLPYFVIKREEAELALAFQSMKFRQPRLGSDAEWLERETVRSALQAQKRHVTSLDPDEVVRNLNIRTERIN